MNPASDPPGREPEARARYEVLALFCLLSGITYLDRICISQAASSMQRDLGLNKEQMALVFSAFTLAYLLFEIPTGWLGDRFGPKKILIRIVIWWSAFTALTGSAGGLWSLLLIRFAFGAGEAGAFPNIARALVRWFPSSQRGRVQGTIWTTARLGGALAPPLTALLMAAFGWRWAFRIFAVLGIVWAVAFQLRYREAPPDAAPKGPETDADRRGDESLTTIPPDRSVVVPWRRILGNRSVWGLSGATFCSAFAWYFFVTWLPTYLEEERHVSLSRSSWLASLPLFFGVFGCAVGGWMSDRLVHSLGGVRWARRIVGFVGATFSGLSFLAATRVTDPVVAVLLMALSSFWNDVTLSSLWAANMDIGERFSASVSGVVNTASGMGAFFSPLVFARLLKLGWGWTPSLTLSALVFLLGGLFWLLVDPTRTVAPAGDSKAPERRDDLLE